MGDNLVESWKKQVQWYSDNNYFSEVNRAFTFRFTEHLDIGLVGVGRRGGMGRWKQRFFMTDVGSLVRCGASVCITGGWWDG